MARNIHDKPFDSETLTKLEIFEAYTKEWLPTMIMSRSGKAICIFDFFAGPGCDLQGVPGTPIRVLSQIKTQYQNIIDKRVAIYVWFNEYSKKKYQELSSCIDLYIENSTELKGLEQHNLLKRKVTNEDFALLFPKVKGIIDRFPTLAILDQNGIKFTLRNILLNCALQSIQTFYIIFLLHILYGSEEKKPSK